MSSVRFERTRVVLVASLLCWPAFAGAQQDDPPPPSDQNEAEEEVSESGRVLDVVVVTAQKREEDVADVPLAISTIDPATLELIGAGGMDVRFLSARVPSLQIESSFGRSFPRFYIRGLGNTDFDLNASQPVSMVYDEVVLENPVLKGRPVFDVERVEVMRGPQGTLFGRNTPAGIVKFDSIKPAEARDGYVRASFGTYENVDFRTAIGGQLSDTLSARFAGVYQRQGDWVDNGFTGEEDALGGHRTAAGRFQLLWQPTERFDALFALHAWDVDGTSRLFRANILVPGSDSVVPDFRQDQVFHDGLNEQQIEGHGATMKLEWDLGSATVTSVTGFETLEMFSRGDIDGGFGAAFAPPSGPGFIPFPSESADGIPELDQLTQELRIASTGEGSVDWVAGLFYFDESLSIDTFSFASLANNELEGYAFQSQDAQSWAAFGSLWYHLNDRWTLQAGLRYTEDEKDFAAERPDPTFQTPTFAPILASTDDDFVSWDTSATYAVSDRTNIYGRIATSFRAPSIQGRILFCADFEGGTNPATNCVSVAEEEEILSQEIGLKTESEDRRRRLSLAGYQYEVDGQQLVAVGGQFNTATLLNADTTKGYGLELDLELLPTSEWLLKLGLSYNNTEIDDPTLAVAPCGGGCTVLDPIGPFGALVDGNPLPHAPEWIIATVIDYRKPTAGGGVLGGALDVTWTSEKSFFLYQSEEFQSDSFEVGLRLAYTRESWELALFGRNLTDEVIVQSGIDFNNLTGMTNEPRIVGIEVVRRFF